MDWLSIILVAAIVIWFVAAIRYIVNNKGACSCGSSRCSEEGSYASCGLKCNSHKKCDSCGRNKVK